MKGSRWLAGVSCFKENGVLLALSLSRREHTSERASRKKLGCASLTRMAIASPVQWGGLEESIRIGTLCRDWDELEFDLERRFQVGMVMASKKIPEANGSLELKNYARSLSKLA